MIEDKSAERIRPAEDKESYSDEHINDIYFNYLYHYFTYFTYTNAQNEASAPLCLLLIFVTYFFKVFRHFLNNFSYF
jgi:hypothetical protein